jgi:4a-hydroxytetrahydrobiopterin dehydratase
MTLLSEKHCSACRADATPLTAEEIDSGLQQLPGWSLVPVGAINQLARVYKFRDFASAMVFARELGDLAESVQHHPAILVEWGKVEVRWWTHKIRGLHENDLIMAAKTETLYQRFTGELFESLPR